MSTENVIETGVLVVGGGGAGFRAAIGARETGTDVILVSKGPIARCGATPMAGADFTMDGKNLSTMGFKGDSHDNEEKVFNDIVTQGFFLNNQRLVGQYISSAPERLKELLDWGIKVIDSEERAIFTSGLGIMNVLVKKAREIGVNMVQDVMILDLVTHKGKVLGALGLDIRKGEFIRFRAQAVVIATGGWHKAFYPTTGMRDLSGEGIAMAYRAGAEIGNMEFITFCCNVLYAPPIWQGSIASYITSLVCGGRLANIEGEDFIGKYDPLVTENGTKTEWNKCFVSFATALEVRDGKGLPNGAVHYGRGDVPWEEFQRKALPFFPNWKYKALDLTEFGRKMKHNEPVEVGPAAEYFDGGIVINDRFETGVEGLYAAGECTLGPFGANRVFSAITEIMVHGADAGRNAGEYVKTAPHSFPDFRLYKLLQEKYELILERKENVYPARTADRIRRMAHRCLGPVRNKKDLNSFEGFLSNVKKNELPYAAVVSKSRIYNKEWIDAIELENMVQLLEISVKSALLRKESRGVHYREDYPFCDNKRWLKESIVKQVNGKFEIGFREATITMVPPPAEKLPYLKMMKKMMEMRSDTGGGH